MNPFLPEPSGGVPERAAKQALWDAFCVVHDIAGTSVTLFAMDADGAVEVFPYGRDGRLTLRRSTQRQDLLASTVDQVIAAPPEQAVRRQDKLPPRRHQELTPFTR